MKKPVRLFTLLIPMFLLWSFWPAPYMPPPHVVAIDRVMEPMIKQVCAEHQLAIDGYGGAMMNDIEEVSLDLKGNQVFDPEEACEFYWLVLNEFLDAINNDRELQPFLRESPFPPNRFELLITFEDENGQFRSDGGVAHMFLIGDEMVLSRYDPEIRQFQTL